MFRTCIHTKPDGTQCGCPALRNSVRCHWHAARHVIRELNRVQLPSIAGPEGRLEAVNEIIQALIRRQIDSKSAYAALHGIKIAMQASPNQEFDDNLNALRNLAGISRPTS
ncbi:MAG TPA: hypothetical protein VMZ25_03710 [Terriglobales bacterium]|nr:hypothetical protein [Terriglobales bacterium]